MFVKIMIMSLLRHGCLLLMVVAAFYFAEVPVFAQISPLTGPTLEIKLLETSFEEHHDVYLIKAKLRLTFTNNTDRKILLVNKYEWMWERNVFRKEADGVLTRLYHQTSGISYFQRDRERKDLLAIEFPSEKVRELKPGESFELEEPSNILVYRTRNNSGRLNIVKADLEGMSSVWLNIDYIYWDPNLDLDLETMKKLSFAAQLRKKWSGYGALWTEPMKSNLIEIPLPKFDY